ncbi:LysB family phage lysis regulatory protein [Azotobacter salinestris]|uniref:LysB family phage lysis regulatory protein n=1 Tax=Azotobacter salinestris TaxID=69964 RepID=UPI0032DE63B9
MTRSSLLVAVLMALLVWLLSRETDTLRAELDLVAVRADQAEQLADRRRADVERLAAELGSERSLQERLRREQDDLRAALIGHQQALEALRHENQRLRDWAAKLLPAGRQLREQSALSDAESYGERLSGNAARPAAAADSPAH